ncbi:MAG: hypothetical protein IH945_01755 [Armatimonadetes bacterium]|nr:hypothetical protein [Armatimonadota bacterium]
MKDSQLDLRPFRRRVRAVRAWRGLAAGLTAGGVLCLAWAVLDLTGVWFTEWAQLGVLVGALGLAGALVGAAWRVSDESVASSVDRRADLKDRLGTMIEREGLDDAFDDAQRHDAEAHLSALRAPRVFPVRVGRWQYTALAVTALASIVFLLGNSWYMLDPDARKAKAELEKIAAQIERVAKPLTEEKNTALGADERALANEMRRFAKRLEKGRLNKEEAMQRANELVKQAQKLADKRVAQAQKQLQTARQQMTRMELERSGLDRKSLDRLNLPPMQQELLQQLKMQLNMQASPGDNKFDRATMQRLGLEDIDPSLLNLTEDQMDALRKMIDEQLRDIQRQLENAQNLTQDELNQLLQQQQQLQELQQSLELSEEARRILEEFMNSPEYQDIMKAVQELRDAAQQVYDGQPLTDQQIEELEQMLEELAEKLKDSEYRDMVMEQLRAALEQLKAGNALCAACEGLGLGLGLGLGINPLRGFGTGGRSKDNFFSGYGGINVSDEEQEGQGKTNILGVRGQRRAEGEEYYVEVKAPSPMGDRTSVPYIKVLPEYRRAAEKAIEREEIPKEHEKRVREYFESLTGGKK